MSNTTIPTSEEYLQGTTLYESFTVTQLVAIEEYMIDFAKLHLKKQEKEHIKSARVKVTHSVRRKTFMGYIEDPVYGVDPFSISNSYNIEENVK